MTGWAARRFWQAAAARPIAGGWTVELDGRVVRTPAKAPLVLPTEALARTVAAEWQAQSGTIEPETMPLTRAANSAIDKVAVQRAEVAALLADYGGTDLLCYRAEGPRDLVLRQSEAWDPFLGWAASALGAPLRTARGVIHVVQPAESLARLGEEVDRLDVFALTAFHDLVSLTGSLVLGLAAIHGEAPAEILWETSRIDEVWQSEQWGSDDEAESAADRKRQNFLQADLFHRLSRPGAPTLPAPDPAPGSRQDLRTSKADSPVGLDGNGRISPMSRVRRG